MRISNALQIGKAGEHLACFDLISNGFNAFLSDQGLPYDIVVDLGGSMVRVQVKTIQKPNSYGKYYKDIYRFSLRRNTPNGRLSTPADDADYIAFVFMDTKEVQYISTKDLEKPDGTLLTTIDFRRERRGRYVIGKHSAEISIKPYRR
jgi:hypothetical protein